MRTEKENAKYLWIAVFSFLWVVCPDIVPFRIDDIIIFFIGCSNLRKFMSSDD